MSKSPYDGLVPKPETPNIPNITIITPPEPPMTKPIIKSKTFWVNLLTVVAGLAATVSGSDLIQNNPEWATMAATLIGVLNIGLRFVTKSAVTIK